MKPLDMVRLVPKRQLYACVLGLAFGVFLWVASMWQLEIITIWASQGITHFEFPFFLEKLVGFSNGIPLYMGRDIMYGFNFLGYFIVLPFSILKLVDAVSQAYLKHLVANQFTVRVNKGMRIELTANNDPDSSYLEKNFGKRP